MINKKEVLRWANERGLLRPENHLKQMGKMVSEVGELCDAIITVSYTHLRAHETVLDLVCRLLLEKKKKTIKHYDNNSLIHKNNREHYRIT